MHFSRLITLAVLALVAATTACSSDDTNSSTGGACAEAKKVADECNAKQPADGGTKITVNFDQAKCESSGSQGQTAAQCIVTNRSNCDCFLACGLKGTCP